MIRRIPLLLLLLALAGCGSVDLHQAELCEEAARVLFAGSRIDSLDSARDPSAAHAVTTAVTLREAGGGVIQHRLRCGFESSNAKSEDFLTLAAVSGDVEGELDAGRIEALHEALERKGISSKVSWIPTFGPPHGERETGSPGKEALYFVQLVVNGLTYGAIIALVAIGYTLIAGIIGVFNLAFGDIYMIGAFVTIAVVGALITLGVGSFAASALLALPLVMAITAGYSAITDRVVFQPLRQSHPQMPLIASIGLSMVLQGFVFVSGGFKNLWLTTPVAHGVKLAEAEGFGLYVNREQAALVALTLLLAAAGWYLHERTPYGRALRAASQDRRMAALLGVDVERVIALTFGLGGAFAASGGLMAATYYGGVHYVMGVAVGLKAITAAILGGVGSLKGAVLGGFLVALIESLAAGYFFGGFKETAVFAILILVLIFRPQGMFGEA